MTASKVSTAKSAPTAAPKAEKPGKKYFRVERLGQWSYQIWSFDTATLEESKVGIPNILAVVEGKIIELLMKNL